MNTVTEHPQYKKVEIQLGEHRDHIEMRDGPDGQSVSMVISREPEEDYSSLIHRVPNEVPHKQETVRRLTSMEYTLALYLLDAHRQRILG